jgi:hypothetical protein
MIGKETFIANLRKDTRLSEKLRVLFVRVVEDMEDDEFVVFVNTISSVLKSGESVDMLQKRIPKLFEDSQVAHDEFMFFASKFLHDMENSMEEHSSSI